MGDGGGEGNTYYFLFLFYLVSMSNILYKNAFSRKNKQFGVHFLNNVLALCKILLLFFFNNDLKVRYSYF